MTDDNHRIPCARCGHPNLPPPVEKRKWIGTQVCEKCGQPTGAEARVVEPTLAELNEALEPDAREVLRLIAKRMLAGQKHYGRLVIATDRRDWRAELREELLDAIVYREIRDMAAQPVAHIEALRDTHTRCTELVEENRALKHQVEELTDLTASALVVELDDDEDAELFTGDDDKKDHGSN